MAEKLIACFTMRNRRAEANVSILLTQASRVDVDVTPIKTDARFRIAKILPKGRKNMKKIGNPHARSSAAMAGSAFAQSGPPYAPLTTDIQAKTPYSAYVQDARGVIARNPFGLCWRTGYWTPADAVPGCDAPLCVAA
jgi:hypothetical protein